MVASHSPVSWPLRPLASRAGTVVAQIDPETPTADPAVAELVVLVALVYAVSVAFTIGLGALMLAVSSAVGSESPVRAIQQRILAHPSRSAAIGIGTLVGGVAGIVLLLFALAFLGAVGLPDPVALVAMVPLLGVQLFVSLTATIGAIAMGAAPLERLRGGDPSPWLALVVGALVVNIPGLNLVLAPLALVLGTGATVDYWWQHRRNGRSGQAPEGPVES
ncbi:hypothetical protein [Natrinema amylolyticum]|uniref:hypothetical protein n=1 Tax=Natrinema amylolyticum TaxID=2878679 RepID=UPI001CFAD131|nr:hypothetical protein [Natrinema amylolyticum]